MKITKNNKIVFTFLLLFLVIIFMGNVAYATIKDIYEMNVNRALRINELVADSITGINTANTTVGDPNELVEITIKDKIFYNKIKSILGTAIQEDNNENATNTWVIKVKKADLDSITELDLNGTGLVNDSIRDITGIEKFTNLEILHLNDNSISISSLSKLTQLVNLKELYLQHNGLVSLPDLQTLTKLNKLDISGNGISDISSFYRITSLKELYASSNSITMAGISNYLYYLHNLEVLDLSGNSISGNLNDAHFPLSLKSLNLNENPSINKIEAIKFLRNLENLYLNNDFNIEDLYIIGATYYDEQKEEDIAYLQKLQVLELQHVNNDNSTIEISNLTGLKNLRELDLSKNNLTNINGIAELSEKLRVLYLNYNEITDLSPFVAYEYNDEGILYMKSYVNLEHLEMKHNRNDEYGTGLEKIDEIARMSNMRYLDLSENCIHYIVPIEGLQNLEPKNLNLKNQKATFAIAKKMNTDAEQKIILENIVQKCTQTNSKIYYNGSQGYTVTGDATVNTDRYTLPDGTSGKYNETSGYYNIVFPAGAEIGSTGIVEIKGGRAAGSTYTYIITDYGEPLYDSLVFEDYYLTGKIKNSLISQEIPASSVPYILNLKYSDIGRVTELNLIGSGNSKIRNVKGLESFYNLENLNLANNLITSNNSESKINYLMDLENIKTIDLSDNLLTNVDVIKNYIYATKILIANNKINNLDGFAQLAEKIEYDEPVLTTLDLSGNGDIENIEPLERFNSLTTLQIGNNNISNITPLQNMKKLIILELQSNKIQDISKLSELTLLNSLNLEDNLVRDLNDISQLNLSKLNVNNNKINSLDAIRDMSLKTLYAAGNRISQWELEDDCELTNKVTDLNLAAQKLTYGLKDTDTGNVTIALPHIFLEAKNEDSKLYTNRDFSLINCELAPDNKHIIVNTNNLVNGVTATVTINGGLANKTTFTVARPIEANITYNPANPTNQNVIATISFNREGVTILNNDGSNQYTFTENGKFVFEYEDEYGFSGEKEAEVTWIDRNGPEAQVSLSQTQITNQDVIVTIQANEECQEIDSWTLSQDRKTFTKTYTENKNEQITLKDILGNETKVTIEVTNIDKIAPVITGAREGVTYPDAVEIRITDDNLKTTDLKLKGQETTPETVTENEKTYYVSEDGEYTVTATDKAGNQTTINFKIDSTENPDIIRVTGVELDETNITIREGETRKLKAEVFPSNATNKHVLWSTSDVDIVSVDGGGNITGEREGTAIITARTEDGGFSAACEVTVTNNIEPPQPDPDILKQESTYRIEDGYLLGIKTKTSLDTLRENINEVYTIKVKKEDNSAEVTTGNVGTGMVVEVYKDGTLKETLTIVIKGDINGDGKASGPDALMMLAHRKGTGVLTGIKLMAGDIVGNDNKIKGQDALALLMYRKGIEGYEL